MGAVMKTSGHSWYLCVGVSAFSDYTVLVFVARNWA